MQYNPGILFLISAIVLSFVLLGLIIVIFLTIKKIYKTEKMIDLVRRGEYRNTLTSNQDYDQLFGDSTPLPTDHNRSTGAFHDGILKSRT